MAKIWEQRPPTTAQSAQAAWDFFMHSRAPIRIERLWYCRNMDAGVWCVKFEDGNFADIDKGVAHDLAKMARAASLN